jgi:hypothetical protein
MRPPITALGAILLEQNSGSRRALIGPPAESIDACQSSVEALIKKGVAARPLASALARLYELPLKAYVDFSLVDTTLLARLSREYVRKNRMLPLRIDRGNLVAAVADPSNYGPLDDLGMFFRTPVRPVVVPFDVVDYVITRLYQGDSAHKCVIAVRW